MLRRSVAATAMVGAMIGPWLLDRAGVRDPVALGLALGTVAAGMGTAQPPWRGKSKAPSLASRWVSQQSRWLWWPPS